MSNLPYISLVNNTALLLVMGALYGSLSSNKKIRGKIVCGIALGLIGLGVMLNPWEMSPGIFFDTRSIVLSVSGLFFGFIPTFIAMLVTGGYRLYAGGPGVLTGLLWVVGSGILGLAWGRLRNKSAYQLSGWEFYLFGMVVQICMLALMLTMPAQFIVPILKKITLPTLLIFPVGTFLLAKLLAKEEAQIQNKLALDKSERQFHQLIELSPVPLAIVEGEDEIVYLNKKFCEVIGYTLEDIPTLDKWWVLAYPDEAYRKSVIQSWLNSFDNSRPGPKASDSVEFRVTCKDGTIRDLLFMVSSIGGQNMVILNDMTREREIDRMKSEFIATAAHELNTPLTTITGFTEILLSGKDFDWEQRKEYLSIVYDKTAVLSRLIDDLLNIGRVESGRGIHLEVEDSHICELISSSVHSYQKEFPARQITLELPESCPLMLAIDPGKIGQVMENLLSNAVKYSPKDGAIQVKLEVSDQEMKVSVRDQGIGMSKEQIRKIFERFYRADLSATAVAGMGLGMSIVKNIIEAHGGTIWVKSTPDKGTTVSFTLPIG